ncbi:MAG TPA: AsmA family protein, partial [Blastocatellia bacterium]
MARRRKILLYLILLIGALMVVVAVAMPLVPLTAIEPAVESKLSEALGRKVTVDSLRLHLVGDAYFTITGMTVEEDPAFDSEPFLRADDVRADIDLLQYLRNRQIRFESITVKSAQVHLVRNADGSWNWATLGKQSSEPAASL